MREVIISWVESCATFEQLCIVMDNVDRRCLDADKNYCYGAIHLKLEQMKKAGIENKKRSERFPVDDEQPEVN